MGRVLLPGTAAMDDVAAALEAPVTRYEGVHDAVSRLRAGGVDCVVVDGGGGAVADRVPGVIGKLHDETTAQVVLAVAPADAATALDCGEAAVIDRTEPAAAARELARLRAAQQLERGERRTAGARAIVDAAVGAVGGASSEDLESVGEATVAALGGTEPYPTAWVGRHDPDRSVVRPVAAVGVPKSHLRAVPVAAPSPSGGSGGTDTHPGSAERDGEGSPSDADDRSATSRAVTGSSVAVSVEQLPATSGGGADEPYLLAVPIPTDPAAVLHLVADRPGGVPGEERAALADLATTVADATADDAERSGSGDRRLLLLADALTHELSNQLSAASLQLDLAAEHGDDEHFEHVSSALDRLEGLTEETRALARAQPETEWTDLGQVAREAWNAVGTTDATLSVEDATLELDPALLRLALVNLLRNAAEHGTTGDGTTAAGSETSGLRVTVGPVGDEGVFVADDGPGIPPDEHERVLEWGHSGGDGSGVGLGLVTLVADRHGWTVEITESEWGGARVELAPPA
jgi:signal transduction histidine kinase